MSDPRSGTTSNLGVGLALAYGCLVFGLLTASGLSFPLGQADQSRMAVALGAEDLWPRESWLAGVIDPVITNQLRDDPYPALQLARRLSAALASTGLVVWVCRSQGWLKGWWAALLIAGFLPLRLAGISLSPQCFALALLIWGYLLMLAPPWSKTGAAEQAGGGVLLGMAVFSAPWAWLFATVIPFRALFLRKARRNLEAGFWWGFLIGLIPGAIWVFLIPSAAAYDFGLRLETLRWEKFGKAVELVLQGWGWVFSLLVLAGMMAGLKGDRRGLPWLAWPIVPSLLGGYIDPVTTVLAVPILILLAVDGLEKLGKFFVSRGEQRVIPTLLALGAGYHLLFSGTPQIRAFQDYSHQDEARASLIVERIPSGAPVALFQENSLLDYLNALHPERKWLAVPSTFFLADHEQLPRLIALQFEEAGEIWLDPARLRQAHPVRAEAILGTLGSQFKREWVVGENSVELYRYRWPATR